MKIKTGHVRWIVAGALAMGVAALPARAADLIRLTNGKTIQAKDIQWRESEKAYRVTTPDGVTMPVPRAQVERLEIARPATFAQAESLVAGKQFGQAIPILDDIVTKYRMKVWDNEARKLLAQCHMAMNDPKKAAAVLDDYMASVPKADLDPATTLMYWRTLLAAGRGATLKKELDEVVAAGSRPMAAAAMVMRGNMNREAGQKEAAVIDYLRVVILFENVKAVQPEALFKAAELLEEMRDARADELRKKLIQEYRDSEYAAKLSGKI